MDVIPPSQIRCSAISYRPALPGHPSHSSEPQGRTVRLVSSAVHRAQEALVLPILFRLFRTLSKAISPG